jgi:hypothetical protein
MADDDDQAVDDANADDTVDDQDTQQGTDDNADDAQAAKDAQAADADKVQRGDNAQTKARKWERQAKRDREAREKLEAENKKLRESSQSDQDRALTEAKAQARTEALSEATPRMRALALELAVTRLASVRGIKVGDGEDAKTVRFSDPDDVQMWLERQIRTGDLDEKDIYTDDGGVDRDALTDALVTLAAEKPTWLAGASNGGARKPAGDVDAGKGKPSTGIRSVEEELAHIQRGRRPTATT